MGVGGLLQPEPWQPPGLGEQAFPEEFGAHDGVRASCACSWIGIAGATVGRKGNLLCFGLLLEMKLHSEAKGAEGLGGTGLGEMAGWAGCQHQLHHRQDLEVFGSF